MTDRKGTRNYQRNYKMKLRRRREGKTDYQQRRNMLRQDVNKFGAVKSRLVVRITNSKVICQIIKAYVDGDRTVASATSTELKKYGVEFGLTNYFAAYATGMLCARRALAINGLENYPVNKEIGEHKLTEDLDDSRRAYKVFLDLGLAKASKGAKVFAAMKGASDGGLFIPHSPSKFVGYDGEKLDASVLKDRIFMKENAKYMSDLMTNDKEKYNKQFSYYAKLGIKPEDIEKRYVAALEKIATEKVTVQKEKKSYTGKKYVTKQKKLSSEERKAKVAEKLKVE
ncbi:rpl5a [Ecytonucleospora hepatopenaei]|uniref:Rpl5a n=1 Tax=Ecytonucleospora hepatopenaei TaxID=646526 RepID=A0A1W0E4Q4_9MICR|nr:rpl5a [Ecytonucleospora hepatopenaei]